MTGSFSVKIKSKKGQFILKDLLSSNTIADLKSRIAELQLNPQTVLIGFPPRPLDLSQNSQSIDQSGIKAGETLIVEEHSVDMSTKSQPATSHQQPQQPSIEDDEALARRLQAEEEEEHLRQVVEASGEGAQIAPPPTSVQLPVAAAAASSAASGSASSSGNFDGILLKKVVPADNSCLFTSVRFVLNGKVDNEGSEMMRHIIAQEVAADPQQYNDAVLGKTNAEYCTWIQRPESWGGAIEVAILSNYYGIEIDVVDIQNAIINRFGEDRNYGLRVFLLFDGIHYDPLYMETVGGGAPATIFPVEELGVYQQAEQLANEAKSSRQFTNVDKFTLRCIQCDVMLVGQTQAQQHAKSTGHTNFGEI